MLDVAREAAHLAAQLRRSPKKVVVLDLDNTLWGGVIGDDGLDGIELGNTSPRGEAFKAFQKYLLGLTARGVLLAVCSKNDEDKALEPFEKHPEMVLRRKDFVAFKANWNPKSDNILAIASELNLGLDSLVFVDDNPAEIEIVRQFVPEVSVVNAGSDPSEFIKRLEKGRFFEHRSITVEDVERGQQYQQEAQRLQEMASATDMESYLRSLMMNGTHLGVQDRGRAKDFAAHQQEQPVQCDHAASDRGGGLRADRVACAFRIQHEVGRPIRRSRADRRRDR